MAEVRIPRSLAALFPGTPTRLSAEGATVEELIAALDAQVPGLRNRVLDSGPSIRTHINVFVAGQRATLATAVPANATVHIIPAVSGGEDRFVPLPPAEGHPEPGVRADVHHPGPPHPGGEGGIHDPRALQILSTEHWSLLTARSLVYNETFARGGMFLAVLSATLVALGLISTATAFSDAFLTVAGVVLALDLFIGFASLARILAASHEDLAILQGMNRLRHAYFEIVPGLDPYFITSGYDDFDSVLAHYGGAEDMSRLRGILHGFTTMPGMVAVICCGLVGMIGAIVALFLTHDGPLAGVVGLAIGAVTFVLLTVMLARFAIGTARSTESIFPRPGSGRPRPPGPLRS
jgi:molybdopterin converting factor small subunit